MAEPTLSLTRDQLNAEVGFFLGEGADPAGWSAGVLATIGRIVSSGLRNFYVPQPLPGDTRHEWSFLRPQVEMDTVAPYATGTVAVTNGNAVVTLSGGTWPSWAAGAELHIAGVRSRVLTRDSGTQLTLTAVFAGTTDAAATYQLLHPGDYQLPDDFGGITSELNYAGINAPVRRLPIVPDTTISRYRASSYTVGPPSVAAVAPIVLTPATGQRWYIKFWPIPDLVYTLRYSYFRSVNALASGSEYHAGGSVHAETILESCLAVAEQRVNDTMGIHTQAFMTRLAASIAHDRAIGPRNLGQNLDASDALPGSGSDDPGMIATYNGQYST
jgi:hypothetical protein